jgi:hypothetical protein
MMKSTFPDQLFSMDVSVFGPNSAEFSANRQYEKDNKLGGSKGMSQSTITLTYRCAG